MTSSSTISREVGCSQVPPLLNVTCFRRPGLHLDLGAAVRLPRVRPGRPAARLRERVVLDGLQQEDRPHQLHPRHLGLPALVTHR